MMHQKRRSTKDNKNTLNQKFLSWPQSLIPKLNWQEIKFRFSDVRKTSTCTCSVFYFSTTESCDLWVVIVQQRRSTLLSTHYLHYWSDHFTPCCSCSKSILPFTEDSLQEKTPIRHWPDHKSGHCWSDMISLSFFRTLVIIEHNIKHITSHTFLLLSPTQSMTHNHSSLVCKLGREV